MRKSKEPETHRSEADCRAEDYDTARKKKNPCTLKGDQTLGFKEGEKSEKSGIIRTKMKVERGKQVITRQRRQGMRQEE